MALSKFYKSNIFYIVVLILLCFPSLYSLFHNGIFVSDDGEWMIIRLSAFYEMLKLGEVPVRFIARLNNGYGYPVSNFMYPGFLYFGSFIHLFGFGFVTTIKIIFGLGLLSSGVFTYFWLGKLFSKIPAFFGAVIYIYMPYHLFDLYVRGSVGEVIALSIIPFIFWQIERKSMLWIAFGIATLILSHNTLAFLFVIPLALYAIIQNKQKDIRKKILFSMIPFIFGIGLASFFWIPALYDLQYTVFRSVSISNWQQYFATVSLIGHVTIGVFVAGIFLLFTKKIQASPYKKDYIFFIIIGLLSLSVSLPISFPFWMYFPTAFIQFPFRFLSLTILSSAFLVTFFLSLMSNKKIQILIGIVLYVSAMYTCLSYMLPKEFIDKGDLYYISNFSTTTIKDEYMPIWVKESLPGGSSQKIKIIQGRGKLSEVVIRGNQVNAHATMQKNGIIQVNTIYFPGWQVYVDGKKQHIFPVSPFGFMQFSLPVGMHSVIVVFGETPVRLFADFLSGITLLVIVFLSVYQVRYNRTTYKK